MSRRSRKVRWFFWWGWSTEKLEAWLEKEARSDWHLVRADRWLNRFHFKKGPAKQVRYCVDYQYGEPTEEYWTLFEDAGWEAVAEDWGYYIWRTEYEGTNRPEIFSDVDSLIQRNRRLMGLVLLALVIQIPAWVSGFLLSLWQMPIGKVLIPLYLFFFVVLVGTLLAIYRTNNKLRARKP